MPSIKDIPAEIFLDNLLLMLPVPDILRLGCTNRFFYLLTNDEPFWHQRLQQDFNFPSSDTARTTGWKFIYKRLTNPKVYLWGHASCGRLGKIPLPMQHLSDGVPSPHHMQLPGVKVVSLVGSGWAFHALDTKGNMYVWGTLDGLRPVSIRDGFSQASTITYVPMRLGLPKPIRSVSCGRLHAAAFDATGNIWNLTSWGRPFRLVSTLLDRSSPHSTPIQVECGWWSVAVLTASRDVIIWWPTRGEMLQRIRAKNRELDKYNPQSKAKPVSDLNHHNRGVISYIPCYTWELAMDPVRLPGIPVNSLPDLVHTGLSHDARQEETVLTKIAVTENSLIGLTNKGHVLRYTRLFNENSYLLGLWEYLPYFSDLAKVRDCGPFADGSADHIDPPQMMHINHISAHFRTFCAYSTGARDRSVVLINKPENTDTPVVPEPNTVKPVIHPNLQFQYVISVVLGDLHYAALTSTGKLFTWGEYNRGALGLGDPTTIEPGQPGGFATEEERQDVIREGFATLEPPDVKVPTEVKFENGRETFCFAATAGGWHTGTLVIDMDPDAEEGVVTVEEGATH
ncbi:unnamed protein product [Somion occarium]|uniref:F-box domain-containing protein n=1 Tax=Somion occarium TaxID=3059160 RepID=A0ABP1E3L0_9APHY